MRMLSVLTLLGLTLLAGCGVKSPISGRSDPYFREQVHFTDADLANKTAVGQPVPERRDGLLFVSVPIRSASNNDLHIDYRVTFFNQQGSPIEQTGWLGGTTLPANTPSFLRFNSTTANAADFQVDVRWAQ